MLPCYPQFVGKRAYPLTASRVSWKKLNLKVYEKFFQKPKIEDQGFDDLWCQ